MLIHLRWKQFQGSLVITTLALKNNINILKSYTYLLNEVSTIIKCVKIVNLLTYFIGKENLNHAGEFNRIGQ
jgi:hypothetical protein